MARIEMLTNHTVSVRGKLQTWVAGYIYGCEDATALELTSLGVARAVETVSQPTPAPVSEPMPEPTPGGLPDDLPYRDALLEAGFKTLDALNNATDDDITAVNGIGYKALEKIRAYLAE